MSVLQPEIIQQGYLYKMGGFRKSWKKRFFVLMKSNDNTLFYLESESSNDPLRLYQNSLGHIVVTSSVVTIYGSDTYQRENTFGVQANGSNRVYIMVAETRALMNEWIKNILAAGATLDPDSRYLYTAESNEQVVSLYSQREGFLWKCGGFVKTWKRRYFVLENDMLHYYKDKTTEHLTTPLRSIALSNVTVNLLNVFESGEIVEMLPYGSVSMTGSTCFTLAAGKRKFIFVAFNEELARGWCNAIRENIDRSKGIFVTYGRDSEMDLRCSSASRSSSSCGMIQNPSMGIGHDANRTGSNENISNVYNTTSDHNTSSDQATANQSSLPVELSESEVATFVRNLNFGSSDHVNAVTETVSGWVLRACPHNPSRHWVRRYVVVNRAKKMMKIYFDDAAMKSDQPPLKIISLVDAEIAKDNDTHCIPCKTSMNPTGVGCAFSIRLIKKEFLSNGEDNISATRYDASKFAKPALFAATSPANCNKWLQHLTDIITKVEKPTHKRKPSKVIDYDTFSEDEVELDDVFANTSLAIIPNYPQPPVPSGPPTTSTAPTSTAPTSTVPTSTAPTSTVPTSTAPTSTAPTSTVPASTAPPPPLAIPSTPTSISGPPPPSATAPPPPRHHIPAGLEEFMNGDSDVDSDDDDGMYVSNVRAVNTRQSPRQLQLDEFKGIGDLTSGKKSMPQLNHLQLKSTPTTTPATTPASVSISPQIPPQSLNHSYSTSGVYPEDSTSSPASSRSDSTSFANSCDLNVSQSFSKPSLAPTTVTATATATGPKPPSGPRPPGGPKPQGVTARPTSTSATIITTKATPQYSNVVAPTPPSMFSSQTPLPPMLSKQASNTYSSNGSADISQQAYTAAPVAPVPVHVSPPAPSTFSQAPPAPTFSQGPPQSPSPSSPPMMMSPPSQAPPAPQAPPMMMSSPPQAPQAPPMTNSSLLAGPPPSSPPRLLSIPSNGPPSSPPPPLFGGPPPPSHSNPPPPSHSYPSGPPPPSPGLGVPPPFMQQR